jgi:hypothetical protein
LLALASLKELSEIIKHLVLEHLVEGLVFRKEEVVYLTEIQKKISPEIISISAHPGYFICGSTELPLLPVHVTLLYKEEKLGRNRSFVFLG